MTIEADIDLEKKRFWVRYKPVLAVSIGLALIGIGGTGLVTQWWQPLLVAASAKMGLGYDAVGSQLIAMAFILAGLALLGFKQFVMDPDARKVESDLAQVKGNPPSPTNVAVFLDNLGTTTCYFSSEDTAFHEEYERYATAGRQLLDRRSAATFNTFRDEAMALHRFLASYARQYPDRQAPGSNHRSCLAPHLAPGKALHGGDPTAYALLHAQLDERVADTRSAYNAFLSRLRHAGHQF